MIILASSSIVWATQDAKDAFGDGFRRIDVLHKVEDLNFLEVVRTFPALSVSDCIRIYGSIGGVPGYMESGNFIQGEYLPACADGGRISVSYGRTENFGRTA